jgi:tetratricopeptide (TPR) repeat protein
VEAAGRAGSGIMQARTCGRKLRVRGIVLLAAAIASGCAGASPPPLRSAASSCRPAPFVPGPPMAAEEIARRKQQEGELAAQAKESYKRGDAEHALALFREAHDAWGSFEACANLGAVALELGHWREAAYALQQAADAEPWDPDNALARDKLPQVKERLAVALGHVGRLDVLVEPEGARLRVDGEDSGRGSQWRIYVDPGEHLLEVRADCHEPASRRIRVEAGAGQVVRLGSAAPANERSAPAASDEGDPWLAKGEDAILGNDLTQAESHLRRAWELERSYVVGTSFGHVLLERGSAREAAHVLGESLMMLRPTAGVARRVRVEHMLADARAKAGPEAPSSGAPSAQGKPEPEPEPGREREPTAESASPLLPMVAGIGFGLGGAALVTSVALTAVANGHADDFHALAAGIDEQHKSCPTGSADADCIALRSADDSRASLSNAAMGTWIGTGVVLLGATVATVVLGARQGPEAVGVVPWITSGAGGLGFSGRF